MFKKSLIYFAVLLFLSSCEEKPQSPSVNLPESTGNINHVSIIIDESLWNSEVGDSIRKKFAAPVDGLPQEEPLFTLNQYPTKIFDGFVKKSRNIILVQKQEKAGFLIEKNKFAYPQNFLLVSGNTSSELIEVIEKKATEFINVLKQTEIKENQRRLRKSLVNDEILQKRFRISMDIGFGYRYDMVKDNFVWLRKEFKTGYNSILVYQVPINQVEQNKDIMQNIISIRDSIGKQNIQGEIANTWMISEEAYLPYLFETTLANKPAYLTKGIWKLKNDFMSGPFVNFAIKDEKNNRYLIIEGFTYLPSNAKRDWVFELEAMIQTAKFL